MVEHRVQWLDPVALVLSAAGSFGAVFLAVALAAAVVRRRPAIFGLTLAAVLVADLLSTGIKDAVDRPRPFERDPTLDVLGAEPSSPSFPSGHAAMGFAAGIVLAVSVPALAWPMLAAAFAISWSRLYAGVHYPLDALGGAAVGALVATALLLLERVRTRSRPRRR